MAPRFLPLTVTDVAPETRDAVLVTLRPRPEDAAAFAFEQGQYLTFRQAVEGVELRRSYSISAGLDDGVLQVGIKRVPGGAFSTWANESLAAGDVIEAMPPQGRFGIEPDPAAARHYLMFAGGSGITPVLSILRTVLRREPRARVTLVYANRGVATIMFREAIEDLKNEHMGRLSIVHVLEQDAQEIDLFTGRVDGEKMEALFRHWVSADDVDLAFICGPEPMMLAIADSLRSHGFTDEQIRFELFKSDQPGRVAREALPEETDRPACEARITLDGATFTVPVAAGMTVLEAAIAADLDAPWSCRAGVCSTCRAKVTNGTAEMISNNALEDHEVREGYVLTCQCLPTGETLAVSYDA